MFIINALFFSLSNPQKTLSLPSDSVDLWQYLWMSLP